MLLNSAGLSYFESTRLLPGFVILLLRFNLRENPIQGRDALGLV